MEIMYKAMCELRGKEICGHNASNTVQTAKGEPQKLNEFPLKVLGVLCGSFHYLTTHERLRLFLRGL